MNPTVPLILVFIAGLVVGTLIVPCLPLVRKHSYFISYNLIKEGDMVGTGWVIMDVRRPIMRLDDMRDAVKRIEVHYDEGTKVAIRSVSYLGSR